MLANSSGGGGGPPSPVTASASASASASAPIAASSKVYNDLGDDDAGWEEEGVKEVPMVSTPLDAGIPMEVAPVMVTREVDLDVQPLGREEEIPDDLMPGGRATAEEAKDLVVAPVAEQPPRTPESLESMPVKELRRLAAQRGIEGADDMKKKEILAALRRQVVAPTASSSVTVEKTLDIREVLAVSTPETQAQESVDAEILE